MMLKPNAQFLVKTVLIVLMIAFIFSPVLAHRLNRARPSTEQKSKKTLYGLASYYANKFHGRRTANGETFSHTKFTAACNVLPLGTWIKITNLKNGKTVVVRTNDRLHPKTRRLVDLTRAAAKQLGFIQRGLTRVKVEVLDKK